MAACNPTARERRYPHVLREYNRLARQACAALSIPYLDLWEIALPLFDISGDGAHYAVDATPVGRAQAVRLLHWLSSLPCMQVLTTAPSDRSLALARVAPTARLLGAGEG